MFNLRRLLERKEQEWMFHKAIHMSTVLIFLMIIVVSDALPAPIFIVASSCFLTEKYLSFGQVFQYFISRVRQKLHVVLCMSPVGEAFRSRCRMFPSLVNCCTIDWFVQVGDFLSASVRRRPRLI